MGAHEHVLFLFWFLSNTAGGNGPVSTKSLHSSQTWTASRPNCLSIVLQVRPRCHPDVGRNFFDLSCRCRSLHSLLINSFANEELKDSALGRLPSNTHTEIDSTENGSSRVDCWTEFLEMSKLVLLNSKNCKTSCRSNNKI